MDEPDDDPSAVFAELVGSSRSPSKRVEHALDDRLAIATDPTTAPSVLKALAAAPEASLRRAVVANPNVPPETLMELGGEFPDELFANPVLSLFLLENPALFSEMPEETLARLMAHPSMPTGLLLEATRHRAFYVRRAAAQNPRMPPAMLVELAEKQSYYEEVAGNPSTPAEYLEKLARHDWVAVRRAAAENPSLPKAALTILANDGDAKVRKAAVVSPAATEEVLAELAKHASGLVRLAVAECARTPRTVLEKLEADVDGAVRFAATRTRSKSRSFR